MKEKLIDVTLDGETFSIAYRTPVREVLKQHCSLEEKEVLAAIVNMRCIDLNAPILSPTKIIPVTYSMREGVLVYRISASLIMLEAARQLFGDIRVSIGQSIGNGYFYEFHGKERLSPDEFTKLDELMQELVQKDLPIEISTISVEEAKEIFQKRGDDDKVRLLKTWWASFVPIVKFGQFIDINHYPTVLSSGFIKPFELINYPPGVILRSPSRGKPRFIGPFKDSPKLFQVYRETRRWNEILGIKTVADLNEFTLKGKVSEIVQISEGLHEKKIIEIADIITKKKDGHRLILIAGPSASGKTTFSKRLSLQLNVNGIRTVSLSTDSFYLNREDTPLDQDGKYDFEAIEAIDLELFNETLYSLIKGEKVLSPVFDFPSGKRKPKSKWKEMQLEPGQIIIVEGIHSLNHRLTQAVPQEHKFKIYISCLTQLCIDDHNRIFTSDSRFLRRIVRDRLFRGYSAKDTIETWPRVRRGEMRNIFPFQENADVMFNSALVYEQAILRLYAERFLLEVPQDHPSFVDAYRLLKFIELFVPIFDEKIPQISILREFVGGSGFRY